MIGREIPPLQVDGWEGVLAVIAIGVGVLAPADRLARLLLTTRGGGAWSSMRRVGELRWRLRSNDRG